MDLPEINSWSIKVDLPINFHHYSFQKDLASTRRNLNPELKHNPVTNEPKFLMNKPFDLQE